MTGAADAPLSAAHHRSITAGSAVLARYSQSPQDTVSADLPGWGLRCSLLQAAFPFHLVLDRDLRVLQVGASLRQLCPALAPGAHLQQALEVIAPRVDVNFEAFRAESRSLFLLRAADTSSTLRGQMLHDDDADVLVFVGSPWVTDVDAFHALGLTIDDFAVSDNVIDYLLLLQNQTSALQEAKNFADRLENVVETLTYQAFHDSLTGLANRSMFTGRLTSALYAQSGQSTVVVSVLYLDLDDFKDVNDRLGHAAGDDLLMQVGQRLRNCVRESDTVARVGGDEFAVLVTHGGPLAGATVAENILAALADPFQLGRDRVQSGGTVGLAVDTGGELTGEEMLRRADVAMYVAKASGKGSLAVYDPDLEARRVADKLAESNRAADRAAGSPADELREAIDKGQLRLHFQPDLALTGEAVTGFEALVRWQHPRGHLVPPGEFILLAEETGLVVPLGRWVLEEACRQAAAWIDRFPNLTVSVNVSSQQLDQDDFVQTVGKALHGAGLEPCRLCLEIPRPS